MSDEDDIEEIKRKIKFARACAKRIQEGRALMAGAMAGVMGAITIDLEFPEPDMLHVYQCMFGHRMGEPTVYRLSFGKQLRWVGISHPWGIKPADMICEEERTQP